LKAGLFFLLSLILLLGGCADQPSGTSQGAVVSKVPVVALVFGQSNAANHGDPAARYQSVEPVFEFFEGAFHPAGDPMKGASGDGSSVWPRLGDLLVQQGGQTKVVFVSIGIGTTTAAQWSTPGESGYVKLQQALDMINVYSLQVSHVLFHQGESDSLLRTSKEAYKQQIRTLVESLSPLQARFYLSIASQAPGIDPTYLEIQTAQKELIAEEARIYSGPNTDLYADQEYRYDDFHFNAKGLDRFAQDWLAILK